jgi:hypothetical protein
MLGWFLVAHIIFGSDMGRGGQPCTGDLPGPDPRQIRNCEYRRSDRPRFAIKRSILIEIAHPHDIN